MINHVMSIFVAIILCFVVIYFAHEHDIPRKFFLHGYECSGQIGGGCEKDEKNIKQKRILDGRVYTYNYMVVI